jgi:hypothetical protein
VKTHVVLDFELSLANTRYQEVRLVPDRKLPEDQERREPDDPFPVVPNDETVIRLTNALSGQDQDQDQDQDQEYYIKRIIENPPRSGPRANLIRRYWDIAGRRYIGVYPIDFHIILTGEEINRGAIRAHSGTTRACITVQGSYANTYMRGLVEKEWDRLHRLTVETLRSLTYPAPPGPDPLGGWGDPLGGRVPTGGGNGAGPDHTPMNPARLLELLGLLDEAFLHGRISDERYREMQSWVQDQLGGP